MANITVFALSTCPSMVLRPSARAYSMIICISRKPRPRPLRSERHEDGVFTAVVVGVGVQADHAEHVARRFLDREEGHGARIVDLGETRDEAVAELLDRREEAQAQILRRDRGKERPVQWLVLGPDRT